MKVLFILIFSALSLFALNIDEAINRAMENNPSLKEKSLLLQASKEDTYAAYSGFKPKLNLSYGYSEFSQKNFVGADSSSSADATLSYNLFNGFFDTHTLKLNQENENVAYYTHEASKADLRLQVHLAYINYLRSKEQIRIAQETITLLEQQHKDAKNFYEQGLFAKNDYLQVDVELSSAKQALLRSKRDVNLAFYTLKRLLGSQLLRDEQLEKIKREIKEISLETLKEKMLDNRSELKLLQARQESLHHAYQAAAANYYPKVDVAAKYQMAGEDPIPDGGATFQTHDQTTTSLTLTWNLYEGGSDQAKRASLMHQESASNERLNDLYLELDLQLEEANEAYFLARNQITVAKKALEQAKENFRITKNQFEANVANTSLMLDAQRFLARSQVDYYGAYFQLYDAMAQLERVIEEEIF